MPEPKIIHKQFQLMPAAPGKCPECATEHPEHMPHNRHSLFYQMKFFFEHQRWPTYADASAHCTEEMRDMWLILEAEEVEKRERANQSHEGGRSE